MKSKSLWLRDKLLFALLVIRESCRTFSQNNNFQTAAALAYYGFFSMIPLLLLVVILLGHLTQSYDAVLAVTESLTREMLPNFHEVIVKELHMLSTQKIWGVFSIFVLVWVLTPFASAIRTAFALVFRAENRPGFLKGNVLNLAAVLALLLLFITLVVGKMVYAHVTKNMEGQHAWLSVLEFLTPILSSVVFLSFFYLVFTPVRLSWRHLGIGSLVSSLLLFAIHPAFTAILQFNPNYGFAFGSLKAVFLLTVWVFYAFIVILAGSEVMANLRREEALFMKGLFIPAGVKPRKTPTLLRKFTRTCDKGDVICKEGDSSEEIFYILKGAVRVTKGEEAVTTLGAENYFGEMSMLLKEPRSATVTVCEPGTELVVISQQNFETILRENPNVVQSILREMAERVRATTAQVS